MANATRDAALQEQARAAIDIVTTAIQDAVRKELDTLRSSVQAHLSSLDRVLSHEHTAPTFEPIIEQLCAATSERVNAMQAALEQQLAKAEEATARAEAATSEAATARAEAMSARAGTERAAADARRELDVARRASEAARQEAQDARRTADAAAASLEEARGRIEALEKMHADVLLQRDIAEAHLEGEIHNRTAIAAELESAREQVLQAKADANAYRLELQRHADRAGARRAGRAQPGGEGAAGTSDPTAVLGHVRQALQTLIKASTGQNLLAAGLDLLAQSFSRAALCAVGPKGLTVLQSRGFDPPLQNRKAAIPIAADSPVTRALANNESATVEAAPGKKLSGLAGGAISDAIALPVVANEKVTMVLYAENAVESSRGDMSIAAKIAGILSDHLSYRLRGKAAGSPVASPATTAPVRRAQRIRVEDGTHVDIDGAEATLVDLSTIGAQVLSPRAMRPNRPVRLLLPNDAGGLPCEARVVWVFIEQNQDHRKARYRAGVQFTEVDESQLDALFKQHGWSKDDIRH